MKYEREASRGIEGVISSRREKGEVIANEHLAEGKTNVPKKLMGLNDGHCCLPFGIFGPKLNQLAELCHVLLHFLGEV